MPGSSWTYSAQTAVARWAQNNRCRPNPRVVELSPNIDRITYRGCRDGADVVLFEVENSGHASPGHGIAAYDRLLNPTSNEVDGTQVAWDFLSRYHL